MVKENYQIAKLKGSQNEAKINNVYNNNNNVLFLLLILLLEIYFLICFIVLMQLLVIYDIHGNKIVLV